MLALLPGLWISTLESGNCPRLGCSSASTCIHCTTRFNLIATCCEEAIRKAELQAAVLGALQTEDYNELTVDEISNKLDDLSVEDLKKVREYDKRTQNR